MKNKTIILGFLFLLPSFIFGQQSQDFAFDMMDFNQKAKTAEWLYEYDMIAWRTTDSLKTADTSELKRLSGEWFCFQTADKNWHAIYGSYKNGVFDLVFHYFRQNYQILLGFCRNNQIASYLLLHN